MKPRTDPPRLRDRPDDVQGPLALAMDDFRSDAPTPEQIDELRTNVRFALGLSPVPGSVHAPSGPLPTALPAGVKGSVTLAQWTSWIIAPLGIGAGAGALVLALASPHRPAVSAPIVIPPSVHSAGPATPPPLEPPLPAIVTPMGTAPPANVPAPMTNRPNAAGGTPKTTAVDRAPESTDSPAMNAPSPSPAATPPAMNETEVSLLTRAQEVLDRDPADALHLIAQHEARFGDGLLVQEREVIAIEALVRLGRMNEATIRVTRFHARFPYSAHGRRIDVLLRTQSN
jgi:hypothetical protein